jgi:hypothetical protein
VKTFPLERVTLLLAFSIALFPPMFQQFSAPSSSQLQVTTGGLACALYTSTDIPPSRRRMDHVA